MWWFLSCQRKKNNIWHLKQKMSDRLAVLGFSCQHCWLLHTNFLVFDSHDCSSGALSKLRSVPVVHLVFRLSHSTCVRLLGGSFEVEFQLAEHIWWTPGQQHTASVIPLPCCCCLFWKKYLPKAMYTLWRPQTYPLSTFSLRYCLGSVSLVCLMSWVRQPVDSWELKWDSGRTSLRQG